MTYCKACPMGTNTTTTGRTSIDDCVGEYQIYRENQFGKLSFDLRYPIHCYNPSNIFGLARAFCDSIYPS